MAKLQIRQSWDCLGTERDDDNVVTAVIDFSVPDEDALIEAIDARRHMPTPIAACHDDEELGMMLLKQLRADEDDKLALVEKRIYAEAIAAMDGVQSRSASGNGLHHAARMEFMDLRSELGSWSRQRHTMESRSSERRTFLRRRAEQRDFREDVRGRQLLGIEIPELPLGATHLAAD